MEQLASVLFLTVLQRGVPFMESEGAKMLAKLDK